MTSRHRIPLTEGPTVGPDEEAFHVSTFGWLRRPELEADDGSDQIWETPEGALYSFPPPSQGDPIIVRPKKVKK